MMFSINPLLAAIALATLPLSVVVTLAVAKRSKSNSPSKEHRRLNSHIEEMHTGHNVVRCSTGSRKQSCLRQGELACSTQASSTLHIQHHPAGMHFINNLNYVAVCVIGGMKVANGALSLGDVQAFIQYSKQFTQPIVQTASIMNVLQSTVASAERVFELLDEPEETPDTANPVELEHVAGQVTFDNVSFRYMKRPSSNTCTWTCSLEPLAIVGPTGAGKTLVNLLMRFYEIDEGSIAIDGVASGMTRDNLRSLFGMVLQDTWLFAGTITTTSRRSRKYFRAGDNGCSSGGSVDHWCAPCPTGGTKLDDTSNISQGQRRLLTIARILADPGDISSWTRPQAQSIPAKC